MNLGEPNPALRRIPIVIRLDDGVTLATNADVSPPAHALQVSINGAAFIDAGGSFFGDGSGLYWYEATLIEASTQGFLAFKYSATGFKLEHASQNVGQIFAVGETNTAHLRWPIVIYQDDGVTPGTGAASSIPAHALQTAFSGAAFGDAAGSLVEVGSGLYYYQGVAGDAAAAASLGIKFSRTGFLPTITWVEVDPPITTADASPPVIAAVSPTPNTAPGAVGGMPSAYGAAALTPIIFTVTDADGVGDLELIQISALFLDGRAEVVYRDGVFSTGYVAGSSRIAIAGGFSFSVARAGGWPAGVPAGALAVGIAIDAVDVAGNATSTSFFYPMPARLVTPVVAAATLVEGAVDLFAEARRLVVQQLRAS